MSGQLGVSPQNLQALSAEVDQGAAAIERLVRDLERKIEPLAADWQGEARQSFENLWAQWHLGAEHVYRALTAISELLAKAGVAYAEAERSIAQAFET